MPQHPTLSYPLSAVVGSDDLVLALLLAAVAPEVGGVLVRGEKGTAKTTAVRGLAAVLPPVEVVDEDRFSTDPRDPGDLSPDAPFAPDAAVVRRPVRLVELPVGAGEDRVTGSIHLERALSSGIAEYEPGLLAKAHRGLLYVDEVNLLHDHLVDLLLDAAATGRATVERDGFSVTHPARFVLVGTMNPEEGELRPQLLDRFGLAVDVAAPRDPALRVEVVRRRLAFEADPAGFAARWAPAEQALAARVEAARSARAAVVLTDEVLLAVAQVCAAFEVDGLRADIVTARTAVAHAAWCGRGEVTREDVRVAARLALPHRRRRNPFDSPDLDDDRLDRALDDALGPEEPEPDPDPDPDGDPDPDPHAGPDGGREDDDRAHEQPDQQSDQQSDQQPAGAPATTTVGAGETFRTRLLQARGTRRGSTRSAAGCPWAGVGARAGCTCWRRCWPRCRTSTRAVAPRGCCAWPPPTCAPRCVRAARPTWCCSASTRRARWPRAAGWVRSRPPSSACCWTPTSAATPWGWSPSAATRPRSRCRPPGRSTWPPRGSRSCRPEVAPRWPRACSRPAGFSTVSAAGPGPGARCWWW